MIFDQIQFKFLKEPIVISNTVPIKFLEFLPLFASIITGSSFHQSSFYLSALTNSLKDLPESRSLITMNFNWIFWFSFIGLYLEKEEKISLFISEIISDLKKNDPQNIDLNFYYIFYCYLFSNFEGDFNIWFCNILSFLFPNNYSSNWIKFLFLFFVIRPSFSGKKRRPIKLLTIQQFFSIFLFEEKISSITLLSSLDFDLNNEIHHRLINSSINYLLNYEILQKSILITKSFSISNLNILIILISILSNFKPKDSYLYIDDLLTLFKRNNFDLNILKKTLFYLYSFENNNKEIGRAHV